MKRRIGFACGEPETVEVSAGPVHEVGGAGHDGAWDYDYADRQATRVGAPRRRRRRHAHAA